MSALVRRRSPERAAMRRAGELGKRTEYLAFVLAGELYGVPIGLIGEIIKPPPVTEVPRAPRDIIGVVSVRGRLVTLVDLRRRFGLVEAAFDGRTRVLLVDRAGETLGLLVDEVRQVYRLSESEIEPAHVLGGDQPAHITGIGRPEGELLVLLDVRALLEGA